MTINDLKIGILQELEGASVPVYKRSLLWSDYYDGSKRAPLEHRLEIRFDAEQRNMAVQAFEELRGAGFIRMAMTNSNPDPENWVEITDAGRRVLRSGLPSEMDKEGVFISHIADNAAVAHQTPLQ